MCDPSDPEVETSIDWRAAFDLPLAIKYRWFDGFVKSTFWLFLVLLLGGNLYVSGRLNHLIHVQFPQHGHASKAYAPRRLYFFNSRSRIANSVLASDLLTSNVMIDRNNGISSESTKTPILRDSLNWRA